MMPSLRPLLAIALAFSLLAAGCGSETLGPELVTLDPSSTSVSPATASTIAEAVPPVSASPSDDVISGNGSDFSSDSQPDAASTTQTPQPTENIDQAPLPTTANELAVALTEAERMVRQSTVPDEELRKWGRRQQQLYRTMAVHSEWKDEVLTSVDEDVAPAIELNWAARESLTSLGGTEELAENMPAWEVVEPLPPEELINLYKAAGEATGVPWQFMAAINLVETRMGRIRGISTAGAVGPMQFLPTTWAECCEGDPTVPADAIMGAAQYLVDRGGPENMPKAVRGYNNSAYYVDAVTAYAEVMMADERAYWGYHGWEIYFRSSAGLVEIPIGYFEPEPVDAQEWVAENPEALFSG